MKTIRNVFIGLAMLSVFLAIPVYSQSAVVVVLDGQDAAQIAHLYAQKADIEKQIKDLKDQIHDKYLVDPHYNQNHGLYGTPKTGWESGDFEFSEDFKAIVPKTNYLFTSGACITTPYFTTAPIITNTVNPVTSTTTLQSGPTGISVNVSN